MIGKLIKHHDIVLITEGAVNKHLEHVEDVLLNSGLDGALRSIQYLRGVRDTLIPDRTSSYRLTVKFDGAPAIICGRDPQTNKFFIGSKGVFNKIPKANYSIDDIYKNHSGGIVDKLVKAFEPLKSLGISNVLQGDLLFTPDMLVETSIDGQNYVTFRPNTITYAFPVNSNEGRRVKNAELGMAFHTSYSGNSLSDMTASFGVDVSRLQRSSRVFVQSTDFSPKDMSKVFLSDSEASNVHEHLSEAGKMLSKIERRFLEDLSSTGPVRDKTREYINGVVRSGGSDYSLHGLLDKLSPSTVAKYERLLSQKDQFSYMFGFMQSIANAKYILVNKLSQIDGIGTFLETDSGFRVTTPEGFVAIDDSGRAVKFVNRLEFSMNNFNMVKNW